MAIATKAFSHWNSPEQMNSEEADFNDSLVDLGSLKQTSSGRSSGRRIPINCLLLAVNQLAVMVHNGIDLVEALDSVASSAKNPNLAAQLEDIRDEIREGNSLSTAMRNYGPGFPPSMSALIAAAESAGEVPSALRRVSTMLAGEAQMRSTIVGAMIYPVILCAVAMIVMLAMIFGVLPQFGKVFSDMGREVPLLTEVMLGIGAFARERWYWLAIGVGVVVGCCVFFRKHPTVIQFRDWALLNAPVFGVAYRPLACGRMLRLLGSMVGGGVPLLEAVRLTRDSLQNSYFVEMLDDVEDQIVSGGTMSVALEEYSFLPGEAAQMVRTAERTGKLADVLGDCGKFYEEQGERLLKRFVHMLEPVIILGLGVVVAGVVLSIMMPMIDITSIQS